MDEDIEDLGGLIQHGCALAVAVNLSDASRRVRDMMLVQQHRGERGCGIVAQHDNEMHYRHELGLVDHIFPQDHDMERHLPGYDALGHCRYATKGGANHRFNLQPFIVQDSNQGRLAAGHNGTIIDADMMREAMREAGTVFQSTSDSEIPLQLIAASRAPTLEQAATEELRKIPSAFSYIILGKDTLVGARCQYGVRPLSLARVKGAADKVGRNGDGYLLASEDCAFNIYDDVEFLREVDPGEMVVFDLKRGGMHSVQFAEPKESFCIFECKYFGNPRSRKSGFYHEDYRQECGRQLYRSLRDVIKKLGIEVMIPILDGGKHGSLGFTRESTQLDPPGIPYREYFLRRHNAPKSRFRSYTAPTFEERELIARMKLDLREGKVAGRVVATGDDTNVRGLTLTINNKRLREAGAKRIYNFFFSPTVVRTCGKGMDHQTLGELIAYRNNNDLGAIAREVGSDGIFHMSLHDEDEVVGRTYKCGYCAGCFGGPYPKGCI